MTLVYAAATPDIGFMVSDTLLEPLMEIKGNPTGPVNGQFHALKIQIIDSKTAVAFSTSNDAAASLAIIINVKEQLRTDPNMDVPNAVLAAYAVATKKAQNDVAPDCEFLVLKVLASGKKLSRVTKDGVAQIERGYIGDAKAYARLVELRKPVPIPEIEHLQQPDGSFVTRPLKISSGETEFGEIAAAMDCLTQEKKIQGVGAIPECVLRVLSAKKSSELEYLQSGEVSVFPWEERGGFSFLASNVDPCGVAVYCPSGKTGLVFVVGDDEGCRKELASNIHEFIDVAEKKYGLKLTGPIPSYASP
jgi:hypothetical protein